MDSPQLLPPAMVGTPDGQKVEVPVDRAALAELLGLFGHLSRLKQDYLLTRFPHCDSDEEAVGLLVAQGEKITSSMMKGWKSQDTSFRRAYELLSGRLVDWAKYIAMSVEAGNALLGALESRRLIARPWADLSAREASAKMQAIQASLDRVVGRKQEVDVNVRRIEELVPREEAR